MEKGKNEELRGGGNEELGGGRGKGRKKKRGGKDHRSISNILVM